MPTSPTNPESVLAVVIRLPAEAIVPLLIGAGVVLVLLFAGTALAQWKSTHPGAARIAGGVLGVMLTGAAAYMIFATILPMELENDKVHQGIQYFSFFDGPIYAFLTIIAVVMWRWADQRWVALGVGGALGAALFLKPFLVPIGHYWDGQTYMRSITDLEHLSYLGPGLVLLIATVVVFKTPPSLAPSPPR